jgi:hypothetical protein
LAFTGLYGIISQKIELLVVPAVGSSNSTLFGHILFEMSSVLNDLIRTNSVNSELSLYKFPLCIIAAVDILGGGYYNRGILVSQTEMSLEWHFYLYFFVSDPGKPTRDLWCTSVTIPWMLAR